MKKPYFFLPALLVLAIASAHGQTRQEALTEGRIVTATLAAGEVHTYGIRLGNDDRYFIAWDDYDTSDGFADITVGVMDVAMGQCLIDLMDDGNFDFNVHRLSISGDKTNPLLAHRRSGEDGGAAFVSNGEYVIVVRGYDESSSGTYRIVFY